MTLVKDLEPVPTVTATDSIRSFGASTMRCPRRHSCHQDLIRDCSKYMTAGFDQNCPLQLGHAFADVGLPLDLLIGTIQGVSEHAAGVPSGKWRCVRCGTRQASLPGAWCLQCKLMFGFRCPP
jgi:hypothetical protein